MNRSYIFLALLLAVLTGMTGCEEDLVLEPAPSKLEGIRGGWTLTTVTQVDPGALGDLKTLDITSIFAGTNPATINFDPDAGTFTYDAGTTIDFIGGNGTWAFDNNDYPTKLDMNVNGTDFELGLVNTIRPADNLRFQLDRVCGGSVTTSYQYAFTRN